MRFLFALLCVKNTRHSGAMSAFFALIKTKTIPHLCYNLFLTNSSVELKNFRKYKVFNRQMIKVDTLIGENVRFILLKIFKVGRWQGGIYSF